MERFHRMRLHCREVFVTDADEAISSNSAAADAG